MSEPKIVTVKKIVPTVGRVVWYWPNGRSEHRQPQQPCAALITYVHSDTVINVAWFEPTGQARFDTSVLLVQPGDGAVSLPHAFAEWMPYQTGQAAKTEQLEAQLAGESA